MKRNNRYAAEIRLRLGLTQQMLAHWLGVGRSSIALAELGRQPPTLGDATAVQSVRLRSAADGLIYDGAGGHTAAPPPQPAPIATQPMADRLKQCQRQIAGLRFTLGQLRDRAQPYEARLVAAAALRAWAGPSPIGAEREASWLWQFEQVAYLELEVCGAGPQRLLEARIAGLEREAELLAELLPPGVPPTP
jgi:DNA-binding XRE family transcriptional regulator